MRKIILSIEMSKPRSGDAFPDPLYYPLRKAQDVQDYAYKVLSNCVVGLYQIHFEGATVHLFLW